MSSIPTHLSSVCLTNCWWCHRDTEWKESLKKSEALYKINEHDIEDCSTKHGQDCEDLKDSLSHHGGWLATAFPTAKHVHGVGGGSTQAAWVEIWEMLSLITHIKQREWTESGVRLWMSKAFPQWHTSSHRSASPPLNSATHLRPSVYYLSLWELSQFKPCHMFVAWFYCYGQARLEVWQLRSRWEDVSSPIESKHQEI
jgi:hypothetical protein